MVLALQAVCGLRAALRLRTRCRTVSLFPERKAGISALAAETVYDGSSALAAIVHRLIGLIVRGNAAFAALRMASAAAI